MRLHTSSGIPWMLFDHGTRKCIPFAVWFDAETGEYEHLQAASNGIDIAGDEGLRPIHVKGKAVGKLELLSLEKAHELGWREPAVVHERVKLTDAQRQAGLEQYKKVYVHVWQTRGDARKIVDERWAEYLRKNSFFDDLALKLKRKMVRAS